MDRRRQEDNIGENRIIIKEEKRVIIQEENRTINNSGIGLALKTCIKIRMGLKYHLMESHLQRSVIDL